MYPARARTRTARSGDEGNNYEAATAPPILMQYLNVWLTVKTDHLNAVSMYHMCERYYREHCPKKH